MVITLLMFALGLGVPQEAKQEKPRVPKDSIELVVTGCLSGRVLAIADLRQTDVESGPDIRARSLRVAGKKDVMKEIKRENHHLVEVTGIVRRSDLSEPGIKIGKGIVIGGGKPMAGSPGARPAPSEFIPVIDVQSVRLRSTSCGGAEMR
jgi:hypothetical protein